MVMHDEDELGAAIPQDPIAKFEDFFNQYEEKPGEFLYQTRIKYMEIEGTKSLYVDHEHLLSHDIQLARDLHENPGEFMKKANQALVNILHVKSNGGIKLTEERFVRFYNIQPHAHVPLRAIRSEHVGKAIAVTGAIIRQAPPASKLTVATFECKLCGARHEIKQVDETLTRPSICNVGGCKNSKQSAFRLLKAESNKIDYQRIRIQEIPEESHTSDKPRFIDCVLSHDIVDSHLPGDRVIVYGQLVLTPSKIPLEYNHFLFVNNIYLQGTLDDTVDITEDDVKEIVKLSQDPEVHTKIINSIAPDIYGYEEIKHATALVLFGGVSKIKKSGHKIRGDIHIMVMGDPGTGKSQIIKSASRIAPKAVHTSGKGSTAAGLTSAVLRDEITGAMVLEAGALVMADGGIAAIDEFDKMRSVDRVALHQIMEQQTCSIAKAGIVATLNARTSIIAAANPKSGRYDPDASPSENINLPPSILTRFDLLFIVMDKPNLSDDAKIADHILKLHMPQNTITGSASTDKEPLKTSFLKKYIKYIKNECTPELTPGAAAKIKEFYLVMRKPAQGSTETPIPIVARALEGLIRMSEAHAKMALRDEVLVEDVEAVIDLMKYSMQQVGWDAERQVFDVDKIQIGRPKSKFEKAKRLLKIIHDLQDDARDGVVHLNDIIQAAIYDDIKEDEVGSLIELLHENTDIIEVKTHQYMTVK